MSQFLTNPRAQTLAGRPRRRITFGSYDRTAGYPVVCDLSGTPAAVAELERALVALPRLIEASARMLRSWGSDDVDEICESRDLVYAALALLDAPDAADAPPVAAHAAVDDGGGFDF
jgi:hypothetical protein